MSSDGVGRRERLALCDLFERLGPDAPTLCEGWTTRDLAAHLVVRDTHVLALPGEFLPPFHPITAHYEQRAVDGIEYPQLIDRLRHGPPRFPLGLIDRGEFTSIHEYFVHHEDVRRANGLRARRLSRQLDTALWWRLRTFGPYLVRNLRGLGVRVHTPDGRSAQLLLGRSGLELTGAVGELFMFGFNRREGARVRVDGSQEAVGRLERTRLGL